MNEHTAVVSETNLRGYVAVCSCGWLSNVHRAMQSRTKSGAPRWDDGKAQRSALDEHARHARTEQQRGVA